MNEYLTDKGYCKWCRFKHEHHPSFKHCKKMIERVLSKERIDDKCHHCNHSKREHTASRQTLNESTNEYETYLDSCCNHIKKGVKGDDFDSNDYCDCEVFL
jgi:hypothetical protein